MNATPDVATLPASALARILDAAGMTRHVAALETADDGITPPQVTVILRPTWSSTEDPSVPRAFRTGTRTVEGEAAAGSLTRRLVVGRVNRWRAFHLIGVRLTQD